MKVYTLLILTQTKIYLLSQCVKKNSKEIFWNLKLEALEYHSNFEENKIFFLIHNFQHVYIFGTSCFGLLSAIWGL